MLRSFGSSFLLESCSKPWVVFVQIVCAEIRVLLDAIETSNAESSGPHMLPICLEILHQIVKFLVNMPEDDAKRLLLLSSTQQSLVDTIIALVAFMDDVYANYELALLSKGHAKAYPIMDTQNIVLSLRVLSDWIAEETEMPAKELKTVLQCATTLCQYGYHCFIIIR